MSKEAMNLSSPTLSMVIDGTIIDDFSGNSGVVYLVQNRENVYPRRIAYKTCKHATDDSISLIKEEAEKWNLINSRYIVPIYYMHRVLNEYYICMRACNGTLMDLLNDDVCEISAYVYSLQIIKGLIDMNKSSIIHHQDFNPQNILYEDMSLLFNGFPSVDMHDSHRYRMMISDFAMSNYYLKNNVEGKAGGKFPFKAPEQYEFNSVDGFYPDKFALGVLLCILFSSKHPCGYPAKEMLRKNIKNRYKINWEKWALSGDRVIDLKNSTIRELIIQLLSVDPEKRPNYDQCFNIIKSEFEKVNKEQCDFSLFYIDYFDGLHDEWPREQLKIRVN
ncbi:TPA: protein kinase family protein [Klebsiella quasipneumoniae subsp. similipneumoniae]|nr:protein kinase family protein [Klebsiella quasipneumoniae subsp. similipneumoniae]